MGSRSFPERSDVCRDRSKADAMAWLASNGRIQRLMSDLLSDIVRSIKLEGSNYYRAELYGRFGLSMPHRPTQVRFHFVMDGELLIAVPGEDRPCRLRRGDVFLVTRGAPHILVDDAERTTVPLEEAKRRSGFMPGEPFKWGDGDRRATLVCGEFASASELFHPVFRSLPSLLLAPLEGDEAQSTLADVLRLIDQEMDLAAPGWVAVSNRMSEIVMIQVLRAWLHRQPDALGALRAMRDPRIKLALDGVHQYPEKSWTVQTMAEKASMSRTAFATAFHELMGVPPMQYLASWRMEVARSLLHNEALGLAEIGERVGYRTQASFTKAFREIVGSTPGTYRAAASALAVGGLPEVD